MPIVHEKPTTDTNQQIVLQVQESNPPIESTPYTSDISLSFIVGLCLVIAFLSKPLWGIIGFVIRMFVLFVALIVGLFVLILI